MIELAEALTLAKDLNQYVTGKTIREVLPPSYVHKFCWFQGEPAEYGEKMNGHTMTNAVGFGSYVEMLFDDNVCLMINDGVNIRLLKPEEPRPKKYQLLIEFTDKYALGFTVAMYGAILCHNNDCDNEYYLKNKNGISPYDEEFDEYYWEQLKVVKQNMSAKAFLATEQRIPGLGNGTLQDILLCASIHPKRKIGTLTKAEKENLLLTVKKVIQEMVELGGRDTEKNLFGEAGGYHTLLSKNTYKSGCPYCKREIIKTAYLGGSVYYCPSCQPENRN